MFKYISLPGRYILYTETDSGIIHVRVCLLIEIRHPCMSSCLYESKDKKNKTRLKKVKLLIVARNGIMIQLKWKILFYQLELKRKPDIYEQKLFFQLKKKMKSKRWFMMMTVGELMCVQFCDFFCSRLFFLFLDNKKNFVFFFCPNELLLQFRARVQIIRLFILF